jgi:SAM-dependent methyltransferase
MVPYFQNRLRADGAYLGVDLHDGCIDWCRRQYAGDDRFDFGVLPQAYESAAARRYDLVLAKSLFTHLCSRDAADYLAEIARVLERGGRLALTAFLFEHGTAVPALPHSDHDGRVRYRTRWRPEAAVGFDRAFFLELLARAGLQVLEARYWFWPGDRQRLSAQDTLICGHHQGAQTVA